MRLAQRTDLQFSALNSAYLQTSAPELYAGPADASGRQVYRGRDRIRLVRDCHIPGKDEDGGSTFWQIHYPRSPFLMGMEGQTTYNKAAPPAITKFHI